jgi:acyl transferase domain-containing protein
MRPFVDWSLYEQLNLDPDEPGYRLNEIHVIQPVLVSIEIALGALWRSWGIEADAVVGHSMGEVAAANLAGALSLDDAMRIICARSTLLRALSGKGAMAVVALRTSFAALSMLTWHLTVLRWMP